MLARLPALIAPLVPVLTGCVSATDAPLARAEPNTTPGVIIRAEGDGTARTDMFTLDGSYDVHWSLRSDGHGDCKPGNCLFIVTLMTTGHDFFSSVTQVDRYDPGSGAGPAGSAGSTTSTSTTPMGAIGRWKSATPRFQGRTTWAGGERRPYSASEESCSALGTHQHFGSR
jgi:hypothetical protein